MNPKKIISACIVFLFLSFNFFLFGQKLYEPNEQIWKPMKDEVYLQEVASKIKTDKPVQDIAMLGETCFAVIDGTLNKLQNGQLLLVTSSPKDINRLIAIQNTLWILSVNGIYQFKNKQWKLVDKQEYIDVCLHQGKVHAATKEAIYTFENGQFVDIKPKEGYNSSDITMLMEDGSQIHADPVRIGPITRIQSYNETLYILRPGRLVLLNGDIVDTDHIDWGMLPSKNTRDLLSFGSKLFISTDKGLGVLRGASLFKLKGKDGLPFENTTCLTKGFDQDIWIGTTKGAKPNNGPKRPKIY